MTYVIIRDKNKPKVKRCKRIKLRDTSNFSPTTFKNDLVVAFSEFLNSLAEVDENNFDIVFNDFHDRFTKVLDKNAPFKLLSRKRSKLAHKPWISFEMSKKCIKRILLVAVKSQNVVQGLCK